MNWSSRSHNREHHISCRSHFTASGSPSQLASQQHLGYGLSGGLGLLLIILLLLALMGKI